MKWLFVAAFLCTALCVNSNVLCPNPYEDCKAIVGCQVSDRTENRKLVWLKDLKCYCSCKSGKDGSCEDDEDCKHGLGCQKVTEKDGVCKDACKVPNQDVLSKVYGNFYKCSINEQTGRADWKCQPSTCTGELFEFGVCAFDPDNNKPRIFNNDCQFFAAICKRVEDIAKGKQNSQYKPEDISKCAEVMAPNRLPVMAGMSRK